MDTSKKLSQLITSYQRLTPFGKALCGMHFIEKIDRVIQQSDDPNGYRNAVDSLLEIYQ